MGTTLDDILFDQYYEDKAIEEEFEDKLKDVKENNFRQYFLTNKEIYKQIIATKEVAGNLYKANFLAPSFIYYTTCIEQIIKNIIVYPVICGSILDEDIALLVRDELLKGNSVAKIDKLTRSFIEDFGKFNLDKTKTKNGNSIWKEILDLRKIRNERLVHAGDQCTEEELQRIFEVTSILLQIPVKNILSRFKLKINKQQHIVSA